MFENVKQEIDNKIKTNGNNEITATRLNGVLQNMMDAAAEEIEDVAQSVGDQVEANPTGEATTPLNKIKIGETIYKTNNPFSGAVDATDAERLQALANVSNQEAGYDSSEPPVFTGKMGYKVLQPQVNDDLNSTFAKQIEGCENYIFEIRDVFDLGDPNGETPITIPANCTLKFNGGKIINGSIIGNFNVEAQNFDEVADMQVFPQGYNIHTNVTTCSKAGMIKDKNSATVAAYNNAILQVILNTSTNIVLDGNYYITNQRTIGTNKEVTITNGELSILAGDITKRYFVLGENSSTTFKNVRFNCGSHILIKGHDLDYEIERLQFDNCVFSDCRVIELKGVLQDYSENNKFGVRNFIVRGCQFVNNNIAANIMLNDIVVADTFVFENNIADKFKYALIYAATTNNAPAGAVNNRPYQCDFIIRNNIFIGLPYPGTDIYTACLIELPSRLFVENNIFQNIISCGSADAFECYGPVDEYYFNGNTCYNICGLNPEGNSSEVAPGGKIFMGKGAGVLRQASNNIWYADFDECRTLCSKYNIVYNDDIFDTLTGLSIFHYTSEQEKVVFSKNSITIKNGWLQMCPNGTLRIKEFYVDGNSFDLDECRGILMDVDKDYQDAKIISFCNNSVNVRNSEQFPVVLITASSKTNETVLKNITIANNNSNVQLGGVGGFPGIVKYVNNYISYPHKNNSTYTVWNASNLKNEIVVPCNSFSSAQSIIIRHNYPNIQFVSEHTPQVSSESRHGLIIVIYKSACFRVEIPELHIDKILHYVVIDNNVEMRNEFGDVLYTWNKTESYNTINEYDENDFVFSYKQSNNGFLYILLQQNKIDESVQPTIKVTFMPAPKALNIYNAGLVKYNGTKCELWNGTAWVNPDGTQQNEYTITQPLDSNVTNDNDATSIEINKPYIAELGAVDGYTLDISSVQVTMGGVDITSFVFNSTTGVIYIPSVTGNIVITATATQNL